MEVLNPIESESGGFHVTDFPPEDDFWSSAPHEHVLPSSDKLFVFEDSQSVLPPCFDSCRDNKFPNFADDGNQDSGDVKTTNFDQFDYNDFSNDYFSREDGFENTSFSSSNDEPVFPEKCQRNETKFHEDFQGKGQLSPPNRHKNRTIYPESLYRNELISPEHLSTNDLIFSENIQKIDPKYPEDFHRNELISSDNLHRNEPEDISLEDLQTIIETNNSLKALARQSNESALQGDDILFGSHEVEDRKYLSHDHTLMQDRKPPLANCHDIRCRRRNEICSSDNPSLTQPCDVYIKHENNNQLPPLIVGPRGKVNQTTFSRECSNNLTNLSSNFIHRSANKFVTNRSFSNNTGVNNNNRRQFEINATLNNKNGVVTSQFAPTTAYYDDSAAVASEIQQVIKKERRRVKNRLAASRCRKKRLEREARLELHVSNLVDKKIELNYVAMALRNQATCLKQALIEHLNFGCTFKNL